MKVLKFLLSAFSLNSDSDGKRKSASRGSLIKKVFTATVLGFLNFYTLSYKILHLFPQETNSVKLTDIIQTIYDYGQYIVDLYFVQKYGGDIAQEYNVLYKDIDKILFAYHESIIRRRMVKLVAFFAVVWLSSSITDFLAWYFSFGIIPPVMFSVAYLFLLIKMLSSLDLTAQVIGIESRLRVLGDLVHGCYMTTPDLPVVENSNICLKDTMSNQNWLYSGDCERATKMQTDSRPIKGIPCNKSQELVWLGRCYLLMTEQCNFINKMFGVRILLNCLSLMIDMIRYTNIAFRTMMGSQQTTFNAGYAPVISSVMRMASCAAVLVSLVQQCEYVYAQRERTISIIYHMLNIKNTDAELQRAATDLRTLIESRPIYFNMAGFSKLNYELLVSTVSVVVTYTIIILQNMN